MPARLSGLTDVRSFREFPRPPPVASSTWRRARVERGDCSRDSFQRCCTTDLDTPHYANHFPKQLKLPRSRNSFNPLVRLFYLFSLPILVGHSLEFRNSNDPRTLFRQLFDALSGAVVSLYARRVSRRTEKFLSRGEIARPRESN